MMRLRAFLSIALGVTQGILVSAGVASAQSHLHVLHAFAPPATIGIDPDSALIQASDGNFYGTTSTGGSLGQGTVFRMAPAGTITVLHEFGSGADGATPHGGLIQAADGNLYGTTSAGGASNLGTVFRMRLDGTTTVIHSFVGGATDGAQPVAALIQATDGNFYGTTSSSGSSGQGTIFKMALDGTSTILHFFAAADGGTTPNQALLQGSDGNFYGTTPLSVFKITTGGSFTVIRRFSPPRNPPVYDLQPSSRLIEAPDGNFYGISATGSICIFVDPVYGHFFDIECGAVFRMSPAGTTTIMRAFHGGPEGYDSRGLILASDGNFYVTTYGGNNSSSGGPDFGAVFRMTPAGDITVLHRFTGGPGGAHPAAALVQAIDGSLYGTTASSTAGPATAFRMTASGAFSVVPPFSDEGTAPEAALIQARDGNFYGTTFTGGLSNLGTIFRMTPSGTVTVLHSFSGGPDGKSPLAALIQAADGNFYGTTYSGGDPACGCGTVFRMTADGSLTVLHAFGAKPDGQDPSAALIQAADGNLYGTTAYGGDPACNCGTVFQVTAAGTVTVVHAFTLPQWWVFSDRPRPLASLIQATDGNFYGTRTSGIPSYPNSLANFTIVFKMAPNGIVTDLGTADSSTAGLIQGTDGNFYGTTNSEVFRMSPGGTVSVLHTFGFSSNTLIQATDGNFYGTTYSGGTSNSGMVFRMSPDGTVTVLHTFTGGTDGAHPKAALIQATDGNLYGTTEGGGAAGAGVAFRLTVAGLASRKTERAVYRPSSHTWHLLQPDGSIVERSWGLDGDVPVPGDYDGDLRTDMAVYRPSTGVWYILQSSGGFADFVSLALGRAGDVPVPADYDADGITDLAVYRPSAGTWMLRLSGSPATPVTIALGRATDVPVPGDYDGDGRADPAVYRPSTGRWIIRRSSTSYATSTTMVLGVVGDVPVPADYDGDGRTDVAIYRPSSGMWYLQMSGGGVTPIARQWGLAGDIPAPADFDGDGKIDPAVYRPSTGEWWVLQSSSGYTTSTTTAWGLSGDTPLPNALVANAMAAAAAAAPRSPLVTAIHTTDFGGDNRADITVYRPGSGQWFVLNSETGYSTERVQQWGLPGDLPEPGDFDGDGLADAAFYRPSSGMWWVLTSSGTLTQGFPMQWGLTGDLAVPADYDGDGRTDLAVYRPSTGEWYIRWSSSDYATFTSYQWGLPGDVPVPGDYDGDGLIDLAVYRPSNGVWFVLSSSSAYTSMIAYQWGLPGDIAVPGDYDGDGRTDFAIYRPSTGEWYVLQSSANYTTYALRQWGLSGDTPVPADYDGDGITDLAVFRPGEKIWYVMNSATGTWEFHQWGLTGDVPINVRY